MALIRNNVEQVYVAHPTNAMYLVRVTHKGSLQSNATQWVSILISGNVPQAAPPLVINQMAQTATNTLAIGWPAVVGAQYQLQSRTNLTGTNWLNVDGIISARLTNVVVQIPMSTTNSSNSIASCNSREISVSSGSVGARRKPRALACLDTEDRNRPRHNPYCPCTATFL